MRDTRHAHIPIGGTAVYVLWNKEAIMSANRSLREVSVAAL
jgi:hypothetical protein